jgi:hypothetical protein
VEAQLVLFVVVVEVIHYPVALRYKRSGHLGWRTKGHEEGSDSSEWVDRQSGGQTAWTLWMNLNTEKNKTSEGSV